jgi:pyrroloquinoline quinone (PQQ) biosynthesis protein C
MKKASMVGTRWESTPSERLRVKIQLARLVLPQGPSAGRKESRRFFLEYLFMLHSIIRSSVPLMEAAERQCLQLDEPRFYSVLANYYHEHIEEERDHDRWLLNDLESIGVPRGLVMARKPIQAVADLVGSQYYWVNHFHPLCLLGYVTVLECFPPEAEDLRQMKKQTGFPKEAFRTLAEHSSLDQHHSAELYHLIDGVRLNKKQEEWVTLNAIYTVSKMGEILGSISVRQ